MNIKENTNELKENGVRFDDTTLDASCVDSVVETKQYGLIGEKLGHSYSKIIHEQLADYTYNLIPLTREEFTIFMEQKNFSAINVTIPYKCDVIPYLSEIDEKARSIGAVNTIVNLDGRLVGYNTDYSGFLYMSKLAGVDFCGKKVLVLGSGGASKAILAVLHDCNASTIVIANRSPKPGTITYEEAYACHSDAQIIVNTTPVGMYPNVNDTPLNLSSFTCCEAVLDLIYNPLETCLLKQARELGMIAANGLSMLVAQAKYAVEHFIDVEIDDCRIEEILENW